jgi:hypothetical protein
MNVPPAWPQVLDFFGTPLVIEPSPGQLSSDGGLLPIRQFDQSIGLTRAFAEALDDPRDPELTEHTFPEMVRARSDDRKGVQARLQTYPQDHFRQHGVYRESTICCAARLRLFRALAHPDLVLRRSAHLGCRSIAAAPIRPTHRSDQAVRRIARRSSRCRPHRTLVHRHGPHENLWHPRWIPSPERPRHAAYRCRLQINRGALAYRRGLGQSADSIPLREPDQHRVCSRWFGFSYLECALCRRLVVWPRFHAGMRPAPRHRSARQPLAPRRRSHRRAPGRHLAPPAA